MAASPDPTAPGIDSRERRDPDSVTQVIKLARYQLREYLRSRRFVALALIITTIAVIITIVSYHFRASLVTTALPFYSGTWGGGSDIVIVLAAVFFGGDAIAGEFQNKTGYFLMGLPVRRATVYAGKFIAAFLASVAILVLYLVFLLFNGVGYFGAAAFPWQLGVSLALAIVYLLAVLGATFLFSSLFKTSAYGFVLTAILFLFGFSILQDLVAGLVKIEPWMVISYADPVISNVFNSGVNWGLTASKVPMITGFRNGMPVTSPSYTPGVGEGVVIMLGYFVVTSLVGLLLFEREEFT